ncbi:putative chromatin regulator PHD family [Helianthus annuus]|nr:putative chromatin regulator PHD family [Helianthus annuus]KAJ0633244.1 putative chromatin regulator PHD family [Helianthus annuus]KAJ0814131.1 putative chromatin regulator PHD family [Helianthus annuus]KAJ0827317.1 putative chromatin regulator PHD family [Helianthus annuus]
MAPLSTNAISHFLHPAHKLNYLTTNTSSYVCDGCQVVGTGSRFTCTTCNFDLHDYCAKCPTRLTSSTSHQHPMSLVVHKSIPNLTESCRICLYPIKGLAYQCKDCNFWVHPLCVSTNSGHSQVNNTFRSRSAPASQPAAQRIGEQVGVGLATNALYDALKPDKHDSSNAAGPSTSSAAEDEGGFIGFLKSIFESSSEK